MRQVSPESEDIYDFIIELYKSFNGDWSSAQKKAGISDEDLKFFLEYCGQVSQDNYQKKKKQPTYHSSLVIAETTSLSEILKSSQDVTRKSLML